VAMSTARQGADHWRTAEAQLVLAEALAATGNVAKADETLRPAAVVLEKQRRAHPGLATEAAHATAELARRR
jgi:hypothetical protein